MNNTEELIDNLFNGTTQQLRNVLGDIVFSQPRTSRSQIVKMPVDVVEEEKTIFVYAELPGVITSDIDIDFFNNKLTISVEKKRPYETSNINEIKYGHFERVITLPICVTKKETVSSSYINGVLRININKLIEEENKFSIKPI
jgi:HSP20 family protein